MIPHTNSASLDAAWRELFSHWQQTRETWADIKAAEFHDHYIEPIPGLLSAARTGLEEIDILLRKLYTDCE